MVKKDKTPSKSKVTETAKEKPKRVKRTGLFLKRNWWKILLLIIVLAGLGLFTKEYLNTKDQLEQLKNPKTAGQTEQQILNSEINKLAELPQNETPTLATVSDVSKLQSQAFFKNAQNGDKVLIYAQAKRAVLYRPSTNKVIEITSVNLSNNSQPASLGQ